MSLFSGLLDINPGTSVLLVFVLAFLLSAWFLLLRRNLPPGPWSFNPLGHIVEWQRSDDYYLTLKEYRRRFGDVFRLRFGHRPVIVLCGPEVIREALVEKAESFSERPDWAALIKKVRGGQGIIFNDHDWQFARRFAMTTLRDFGVGKSPIEQACIDEINMVAEEFNRQQGKPFNCQTLMANAVSNIVCGMVFNRRFNYDDEKFKVIMKVINSSARTNANYTVPNTIPGALYIAKLFAGSSASHATDHFEKLRQFIVEMIEEHRLTFDSDNIRDFTDVFLLSQSNKSEVGSKSVSEEDAFRIIVDLFLAGTETTNTTLQWFFIYMMYNQGVQEKCREEIQEVIGLDRPPSMADRGKLVFTEATLLEVQRCATIGPMALPHMASRDATVGGYTVPKGTWVVPFIYGCHYDYDIWGDPDNFRPERWIDDKGALLKHQAFMSFCVGKRACAGESLARMEIFLFSVGLLQRFRFRMADKPPNMLPFNGVTLLAKYFEMVAEPLG